MVVTDIEFDVLEGKSPSTFMSTDRQPWRRSASSGVTTNLAAGQCREATAPVRNDSSSCTRLLCLCLFCDAYCVAGLRGRSVDPVPPLPIDGSLGISSAIDRSRVDVVDETRMPGDVASTPKAVPVLKIINLSTVFLSIVGHRRAHIDAAA
jgi:hypothetical protein